MPGFPLPHTSDLGALLIILKNLKKVVILGGPFLGWLAAVQLS